MRSLCNFHFFAKSNLDGSEQITDFKVKGYETVEGNKTIFYFKNENKYKFILVNNSLEVLVNDSYYKFDVNKKNEAIINSGGYQLKASIITEKLDILDNKIEIQYILDFNSFKGEYQIILELY